MIRRIPIEESYAYNNWEFEKKMNIHINVTFIGDKEDSQSAGA